MYKKILIITVINLDNTFLIWYTDRLLITSKYAS